MKTPRLAWLCALLFSLAASAAGQASPEASAGNFEFKNGLWFDGDGFQKATFYSVDGRLTSKKPARIDRTFDLADKWVVPPFAEAHNHNLERADMAPVYLQQGIFYVKVPNNLPRVRGPLKGLVNVPTGVDAAFSNGGLTGDGGHPAGLVRRNVERGNWTEADGEGAFIHTITNRQDLDRKWPMILAGRPDFIKTYLLYSEEFAKRKDDPAFFALRGLDPGLLPTIVERAHRDGLRVSTHVETAMDFHYAVAAGVDEVNHMPGFAGAPNYPVSAYSINEEDAKAAGQRQMVLVTTISGVTALDPNGPQGALRKMADDLYRSNLELLLKHGVRIAIGSDNYRRTSVYEAEYLQTLGVFDNLALLKLWCETTPLAIFPKRKIGHLKEGYEASFLVLSGNPLEDFLNTAKIEMRVKQGTLLDLSQAAN